MEELRRERAPNGSDPDSRADHAPAGNGEREGERRRRARLEGWPPSWAPTIFARRPRS